jgi:uncharacterized membrane protein YeaQ/YmgE (transglycosylase-associated protein family)
MHWIWFIIVGALVGFLGRLFHPGRDAMGFLLTTAVGILSLVVAAAISSGWVAFGIGVVIAIVLVALLGHLTDGHGSTRRVYPDCPGPGSGEPDPGLPVQMRTRGRQHDCLPGPRKGGRRMIMHRNIADWRGKPLVDRDGDKIGKLEDVYVDVETDEPMFGTVKEGMVGRHLTFVPLVGITIGPDDLQVAVSKEQVKSAPNIETEGDELSQADESGLYHHFGLNYTRPETESGRRLARR